MTPSLGLWIQQEGKLVGVRHCSSNEGLVQRDRTVIVKMEYTKKVEVKDDRLDPNMAHVLVGGVVVQLDHGYLCPRCIFLQSRPKRKICFIISSM